MKSKEILQRTTPQPSKPDFASSKWYSDVNRCPLDKFLDCLFDKDYSVLIISGRPTKDELKDAWQKIFTEYAALAGSGEYNILFEKTKAYNSLNVKLYTIESLCDVLVIFHDDEAVGILNGYALKCDLKAEDPYQVRKEKLELVRSRAMKFQTKLDKVKKELEEAQAASEEKTDHRDYFDDMLNVLSETSGYMVRAQDITVSRFVKMIKMLTERQKKQTLGKITK